MSGRASKPEPASDEAADQEHLMVRLGELVTLGGREKVASMLERFSAQLQTMNAADPGEAWSYADVHRLVGLAAMLGFLPVERTWRALETDQPDAGDRRMASLAADEAIAFVAQWTDPQTSH